MTLGYAIHQIIGKGNSVTEPGAVKDFGDDYESLLALKAVRPASEAETILAGRSPQDTSAKKPEKTKGKKAVSKEENQPDGDDDVIDLGDGDQQND